MELVPLSGPDNASFSKKVKSCHLKSGFQFGVNYFKNFMFFNFHILYTYSEESVYQKNNFI